jgi:hypothetical protein
MPYTFERPDAIPDMAFATLLVDVLMWRNVIVGKKAVWVSTVEVYGRYVILSL